MKVIGREGQAKLGAAEVVVARDEAGKIEARYLEGAGVRVREGDAPIASSPDDARFADMHPAAREIALGAHAAAQAILEIVRSK
jgi:hypothetical protein